MAALEVPRDACRRFALSCSWENSARQFLAHVRKVADGGTYELEPATPMTETAAG
jgi:hypothetical protein